MTRLNALFVPNNHSNCHIPDKIEILTAIFRMASRPLLHLFTIKILHLKGEDNRYDGKTGKVELIDGIGQFHGTWGGLAVIPEEDDFIVIGRAES